MSSTEKTHQNTKIDSKQKTPNPSSSDTGNVFDIQDVIGNHALEKFLTGTRAHPDVQTKRANLPNANPRPFVGTLQRKDGTPDLLQRDGTKTTDQGGVADDTNLEQDMRDILIEWKEAAHNGVTAFATTALSNRLDDIESGSWKTFIMSMLGNTIWAMAAFTPAGAAVTAFRISMVGIGVAAYPTVPNKSKSEIPAIQKLMGDYIYKFYDEINKGLRPMAQRVIKENKGITRYRALAKFIEANFKPNLYSIDPQNNVIPSIAKDKIRDKYEAVANDILETNMDIGRVPPYEYHFNEVAYIKQGGENKLAIVEVDYFCANGNCPPHDFKKWVSPEAAGPAMERWKAMPVSEGKVRTFEPSDIIFPK